MVVSEAVLMTVEKPVVVSNTLSLLVMVATSGEVVTGTTVTVAVLSSSSSVAVAVAAAEESTLKAEPEADAESGALARALEQYCTP